MQTSTPTHTTTPTLKGRKPLPPEEKRNNLIQVALTDIEAEMLQALADKHKLSTAATLREVFLDLVLYRDSAFKSKFIMEAFDEEYYVSSRQDIAKLLQATAESLLRAKENPRFNLKAKENIAKAKKGEAK